jgi:hypothetical protein
MQIPFGLLISPDLSQSRESHHGHLAQGTRRIQIHICRHRHVYQVDGGYASSKHHVRRSGKFLQSIIYWFGVPKWFLTDNRTQFKGAKFVRCCSDFGIHHQPSSATHPQTNEQVEQANGLILQGMKTRMFHDLEAKGKNWHMELP